MLRWTWIGDKLGAVQRNGDRASKEAMTEKLAAAGIGREAVNYKLRDWLFSRQRFWGEPFPDFARVGCCWKTHWRDSRGRC